MYSPCDQNLCQNGGTCRQHIFEYLCNCPSVFNGSFCETGEQTAVFSSLDLHTISTMDGIIHFSSDLPSVLFTVNAARGTPFQPRNTRAIAGAVVGTAVVLAAVVILLTVPCLVQNWRENKR